MKYCIYFPLLCLYMCGFTCVSHFPYGALSFREGNTDLHRQAEQTPRWHGDIQPLYTACLSDVSISIFVYPHFSLREYKKYCLSPPALSAFLSSIWASITPYVFCLLSDHLCLCVCCRPSPSRTQLWQAALNLYRLHKNHANGVSEICSLMGIESEFVDLLDA